MTHKQIYSAFQACKKIYGTQEVHVQLIAKQLGVIASEVVEYIEANPTLFVTRMNSINSGYENKVLGNEYPGLLVSSVSSLVWLTTSSIIREGDNGGTIVLTPSAGTFNASTSTANWIVDVGTTGLTLASVNNGTATKTLTFTGTAYSGKLKIACKAAGVSGTSNTDYVEIDIVERNMSAADYSALETAYSELEAALVPVFTIVDMSVGAGGTDADHAVTDADQYVIIMGNNNHNVVLPLGAIGRKIVVSNKSSSLLNVMPNGTDKVNGSTGAVPVGSGVSVTFICYGGGEWITI